MRGAVQSLLVTDIVGSTRLWAEHESLMAVDLVAHDELVSAAIVGAGGRVFKHTGDGMMATFDSAAASTVAASEIQRVVGCARGGVCRAGSWFGWRCIRAVSMTVTAICSARR